MKAALLYADWITTVIPTYEEEIEKPCFGEKLDGLLRTRSKVLTGILNGIDYEVYNQLTDLYLVMPYSNYPLAKEKNKKQLQNTFGLPEREDRAVLGMVSRLVDQKGLDLLAHVMEEILELNVQIVIHGTGAVSYTHLRAHETRHDLVCRLLLEKKKKKKKKEKKRKKTKK